MILKHRLAFVTTGLASVVITVASLGQQDSGVEDAAAQRRVGWQVDVTLPLNATAVQRVLDQLEAVRGEAARDDADQRRTVVLVLAAGADDGSRTVFEDALRLSRALATPRFRSLRLVAYVAGDLRGHAVLPVLACDLLVVASDATLGDAMAAEAGDDGDEAVVASYRAIAARRGLFPPAVAEGLVRPSVELVQATTLDGKRQFVFGDQLEQLRREGQGWQEEVWAAAGQPLVLSAQRLREARMAAQRVPSIDGLRQALELTDLRTIHGDDADGELVGTLLEVHGTISPDRVRRWELNLISATEKAGVNLWVASIDSAGGDLGGSVQLAGTLSSVAPPLRRCAGYVGGRALADAPLIALACRPLYLHPDARLGGPGAIVVSAAQLADLGEAIEQVARDVRRPAALLRGLVDPSIAVHRYTNRRTGEVRYASEDEITAEGTDDWRRQERLDLSEGLTAQQAIDLGLAEGTAESIGEVARSVGLDQTPPVLTSGGIIQMVEWFGSLTGISIILLMLGFLTLSIEAGAPGLSLPGFASMLCFALYFWIQFLNGTAEWLEIMLFVLGVACIAIEVFVLPGFGVFGIGGVILLFGGIVLTSQTFVIPRNAYQFEQLTRNLWLVIAAAGSVVAGMVILKIYLPQSHIMRRLALEVPDEAVLQRTERLADFEYLIDQRGVAETPLRPAGRVRFGEELIQVLTDGSPVAAGHSVKVIEVHGNRVVVAPVEDESDG